MIKIPFKMTFHLRSNAIFARESYLDGLLALCAVKKAHNDFSRKDDIPLVLHPSGVFHASIWFGDKFLPVYPEINYLTKHSLKHDLEQSDLSRYFDATKVKTSHLAENTGVNKAFVIKVRPQPYAEITFLGMGDPEQCMDMLTHPDYGLLGLGKKASLGFGQIESINFEVLKTDNSLVRNRIPMRPLPVSYDWDVSDEYKSTRAFYRLKSPYWKKSDLQECILPYVGMKMPD
jgi:hypothetical protein